MWFIETAAEKERREHNQAEQVHRMLEENRKKAEARERFIKATTCPHCGRHDPIPVSLI
jgi:hypothetical protein